MRTSENCSLDFVQQVIRNVERVIAIELLAACQAIEFLRPLKTTVPLEEVYRVVRSVARSVCSFNKCSDGYWPLFSYDSELFTQSFISIVDLKS